MSTKFRKPKCLRKKDKADIEAEAETGFGDDDNESLERARKIVALKNQTISAGPMVMKLLPSSDANESASSGDQSVVLTEMEEFVWGLRQQQLDEEKKEEIMRDIEDVEVEESIPAAADASIIHEAEAAVGKGIATALNLLRGRGILKETKLVGINIERTQKQDFKIFSHQFHGKTPGKKKQEKRIRQNQIKQQMMMNTAASVSVERMREAQAKLQAPYLVLSGNIKRKYEINGESKPRT